MMGKAVEREAKLFHVGFNLDDRLPLDHPLRRIDRVVDFGFVRPLVAALYGYNGHESLDPALVLRLLFLCFFENVRSERELMRQLPLRLDWLWFCRLDLDSPMPDHSVLSKARRRWGERTFERVFAHVLELCQSAGLLEGRTVHADSTLLRANASLESRVSRKLWEQLEMANSEQAAHSDAEASIVTERDHPGDGDDRDGNGNVNNVDRTDAENTDSGAADADDSVRAVPSQTPPSQAGPSQASPMKRSTGKKLNECKKLNDWLISPVDPDAATSTRKKGGTTLGYRDHRLIDDKRGIILATLATPADTDDGAMLAELLARGVEYTDTTPHEVVGDSMYGTRDNYALLEAERIKAYLKKRRGKDSPKTSWLNLLPPDCSPSRALQLLGRRKNRAEGSFAEAHVRMNHRRCRWRRRWRIQIQCYLVATVQNLKKLGQARGRRRSLRPQNRISLVQALLEMWSSIKMLCSFTLTPSVN
jgi:transposase